MPSTTRFFCCWKARTAASVFGPKMPSTVTLCPRVRSRYCKLGTGCFWSPFFVSGQGLIVPETLSAPFTEVRPESESVIAPVDTSDSRWASATARSRLTDTDQIRFRTAGHHCRPPASAARGPSRRGPPNPRRRTCLLYTSDAADEEDSVDLGGRRIIKKKK